MRNLRITQKKTFSKSHGELCFEQMGAAAAATENIQLCQRRLKMTQQPIQAELCFDDSDSDLIGEKKTKHLHIVLEAAYPKEALQNENNSLLGVI